MKFLGMVENRRKEMWEENKEDDQGGKKKEGLTIFFVDSSPDPTSHFIDTNISHSVSPPLFPDSSYFLACSDSRYLEGEDFHSRLDV